ncbi:NF038130 family PEP-CTERM protein [Pseudanabaena mucicola]|uniref:NF038130 family PEP-CTERM protein n=1 Tax=Pseudanabaena mucicola FACHB-723 TaxID=2692860 RepID=A0ABR7ZZC3_9CYAN|nr:NF038130 family PEP-CTERM protein [Pseudanabaena mucicola]MBD2188870.1 NF038130 family PEP-CTERM protein [Pseudanabaena mucicola FACHB-723]
MKTLLQGLSASALSLASVGALFTTPAIASSLTGATIGGSASSDYLVYDANITNTFLVPSTFANVQTVLDGDADSPTGNVELRASSEQTVFDFDKNTTLSGTLGGKSITLSSLTASDWYTANYNGSGKTFGEYWLAEALTANGFGAVVGTPFGNTLFNTFVANGGFQRFSDPNISYVNQDEVNGVVSIGLAGYYNAAFLFGLPSANIQASEVVKYSYNGGQQTGYLYGFIATDSKLISNDGTSSHTGNYEVTFQGARPVPVPAGFVGVALAGVIGSGMIKRRKLASNVS